MGFSLDLIVMIGGLCCCPHELANGSQFVAAAQSPTPVRSKKARRSSTPTSSASSASAETISPEDLPLGAQDLLLTNTGSSDGRSSGRSSESMVRAGAPRILSNDDFGVPRGGVTRETIVESPPDVRPDVETVNRRSAAKLPNRNHQDTPITQRPRLIYSVRPRYTPEARAYGIQGTVVLSGTVGIDGKLQNVRVIKSLGYGLDENAIEAAKQCRFHPATAGGRRIPAEVKFSMEFRLL